LFILESLTQLKTLLLRKAMHIPENIVNERSIEYSFVFMNIGKPPATVLDVGCSGSDFPEVLAAHGFDVYGIDIRNYHIENPTFSFIKGNIMNTPFSDNIFDIITAISTIEHLGMSGRYRIEEDIPSADKNAIKEIKRIIKKNGRFIMTVPYGRFTILKPWHKVYDDKNLEELIADFSVLKEKYFIRNRNGCWISTTKEAASKIVPYIIAKSGIVLIHQYALACLVLKLKRSECQ